LKMALININDLRIDIGKLTIASSAFEKPGEIISCQP